MKCVVNEVCYVYPNNNGRQALRWSASDSSGFIRLKRNDGSYLLIDIGQEVDDPIPTNRDAVSTKFYIYSLLDAAGSDLIGFHYHPDLDEDPILIPQYTSMPMRTNVFLCLICTNATFHLDEFPSKT